MSQTKLVPLNSDAMCSLGALDKSLEVYLKAFVPNEILPNFDEHTFLNK